MTAVAIGAAPARREPLHRRTLQKVRRNSLVAGGAWEDDDRFRTRLDDRDLSDLHKAAVAYDRKHKPAGRRNGPLGYVALALLDVMVRLEIRMRRGVTFSVATLAEMLKLSPSAVHAAKARLKRHGFLGWVRRYVEKDGAGHARGPQVEQTSNRYWLALPEIARRVLGKLRRRPPLPDDEAQRRAALAAQYRDMAGQDFDDRVSRLRGGRAGEAGRARDQRDSPRR